MDTTTNAPSAGGAGRLIIVPEQPAVGDLVHSVGESRNRDDCVLYSSRLDFALVNEVLNAQSISAVVVSAREFADHARKMLQEAGIALVVHDETPVDGTDVRCVVDASGFTILRPGVPISAICSVMNDRNLREYRRFGITDLGYYRFKFCLFQLFCLEPEAYFDADRIEEFLLAQLRELGSQHWTSIRCVLSDPTSAELAEMGIDVPREANPDLGVRGPRLMERWVPELGAIRRFMEESPIRIQICAPFVSNADEYKAFLAAIEASGIDLDRIRVGFTLEVPAMADTLPDLLAELRVDFVGIGTSDLFALYNGVDRSNPGLTVVPSSLANTTLLRRIVSAAAAHDVQMFVCGDVRRNEELMTALIREGVGELITSARIDELVDVTRLSHASAVGSSVAITRTSGE